MTEQHKPYSALQYHRRAIENGDHEKARLWLEEAKRRGEISDRADLA